MTGLVKKDILQYIEIQKNVENYLLNIHILFLNILILSLLNKRLIHATLMKVA